MSLDASVAFFSAVLRHRIVASVFLLFFTAAFLIAKFDFSAIFVRKYIILKLKNPVLRLLRLPTMVASCTRTTASMSTPGRLIVQSTIPASSISPAHATFIKAVLQRSTSRTHGSFSLATSSFDRVALITTRNNISINPSAILEPRCGLFSTLTMPVRSTLSKLDGMTWDTGHERVERDLARALNNPHRIRVEA
jgi:hypothetical protein